MKEEPSPGASPLLHRAQATVRAVTRDRHNSGIDTTDYPGCRSTPPTSPQLGKLIIRAPKSPDRASSPNYVRTPSTVVRATSPTSPAKQVRGAYVNVQGEEGKRSGASGCLVGQQVGGIDNRVKSQDSLREFQSKRGVEDYYSRYSAINDRLKPSGNTPKLVRKLLLVSDIDEGANVDFRKKGVPLFIGEGKENLVNNFNEFIIGNNERVKPVLNSMMDESKDDKPDRKVKRSESYRMANSPIMFIKKLSINSDKQSTSSSSKIFRTPSEELQEDLINERINYPETVSSPEPPNQSLRSSSSDIIVKLRSPSSPRPKAQDLEPARVLKYAGNDTEIW